MLTQERREIITRIVNQKNAITVQELVDELGTSAATIRRDLTELDRIGKLVKVFGGATSTGSIHANEDAVNEKLRMNVEAKDEISRYAASLIVDDDFVYIDSGTTTLKLIEYITNTRAKYITNGIVHAKRLIEKHLNTMIIGGKVKETTEAIIGPDCVEGIRHYHFTKAFMGTNGVSIKAGFTTPDVDEAMVKAEAIRHSYVSYVLADHSKFGVVSSVTFSDMKSCSVITDQKPDKKYADETVIKYINVSAENPE